MYHEIEWVSDFESSNIEKVGYVAALLALYVRFYKKTKEGDIEKTTYRYECVPQSIFDQLKVCAEKGESVGKLFNELVKKADPPFHYDLVVIADAEESEPVQQRARVLSGVPVGMLWYDNTQTSLEERVVTAVAYYRDKYTSSIFQQHDVFVSPSMLDEKDRTENEFSIERDGYPPILVIGTGDDMPIQPNYFLVTEAVK